MERGKQPKAFYNDMNGTTEFKTEYDIMKPDFLLTRRVNAINSDEYLQSIEFIETREKITAKSGSVWRQIDRNSFMSFDQSEIMLLNWNKPGDVMRYSLIDDSKQEGGK